MAKHCLPLLLFLAFGLTVQGQELRSYDGFGNNQLNPTWGATNSPLTRISSIAYQDSISTPAGQDRENPRVISNQLFDQKEGVLDFKNLSDYVWVFGQFLDHDISLVENFNINSHPEELRAIIPPANDPYFSPGENIFIMRSEALPGTGVDVANPRQHANAVSAFIDGSNVYGSDKDRADWLRTFEGGKLKMSESNLLPWNTVSGLFNDNYDALAPAMADDTHSNTKLFVAGDVRANENPLLIAFHTLFAREHNRICEELLEENPNWNDEELYQHARKLVGGIIQSITYNEWLPSQGMSMPAYNGYVSSTNPSIFNVFSGAAFRLGHTLINSNIVRMRNDGSALNSGNIALKDAFFNPLTISFSGGIEPFLKGMGTQVQQDLDCKVIDDVRNFLFGIPGAGGLDLAAINIERGRERGFPDFNTLRSDFGLPKVASFSDICEDDEVNQILEDIYGSVDNVDPWVGLLAEDHMNESIFGELVMNIIEKQFRALRDGDRFFFENDQMLNEAEKAWIRGTRLHDVIMRNTDIEVMQQNVFEAMPHTDIPNGPDLDENGLTAAAFPNPANGPFQIKISTEKAGAVDANLYDNFGKIIQTYVWDLTAGENFIPMVMSDDYPLGFYNLFIKSTDSQEFTIIRLVKQ